MTPDRLAKLAEPKEYTTVTRSKRGVAATQPTPVVLTREKRLCIQNTPIKQKKTFAQQLETVDPLVLSDDNKEDDEEEEGETPPSDALEQNTQKTAEITEAETNEIAFPPLNEWRDKIVCPACYKAGTLVEYKRNGVKYKCGSSDDKKTCNTTFHHEWIRGQLEGAQISRSSNANDGLPKAPSFIKQKPSSALNPIAEIEKRMSTMKEQFAKIPQNAENRVLADGMLALCDLFTALLPRHGATASSMTTLQTQQAPPLQTANQSSEMISAPSYRDIIKRNLPKQTQQKRPNILDTLPKDKQEEAKKALQESTYRRPTEAFSDAEKKHNVRLFVLRLPSMRITKIKEILFKLGFRKSDIPTIAGVGNNLYEFAVNDHYSATFLKRAQMAGWPILKGYDSTKPADKNPLPTAVKDNIERAVINRFAKEIHKTPIHRMRQFYFDLAEEKGLAAEVRRQVSELEKENTERMIIGDDDEEGPERPAGPSPDIISQESGSPEVVKGTQDSEIAPSVQNE